MPLVADRIASLVDILPTLVDLSGTKARGDFDGRSLLPLLRGEEVGWRDAVFASHTGHRVDVEVPSRAVRVGDWKLIRNFRTGERFENAVMLTSATWRAMVAAAEDDPHVAALVRRQQFRPREELFDLGADPCELVNLADDPARAELLADLRARLRAFLEEQEDPMLAEWED